MIPRAIWTNLKKEPIQPEEEEPQQEGRVEEEKEEEAKVETKVDKDTTSRTLKEAGLEGWELLPVDDWVQDKKEKSVKEWLEKSVEPGEGARKKWVHSLEVNHNPERVAKSSDELIDDVLAAIKSGETKMGRKESSDGSSDEEVITLDSGSEEENRKTGSLSDIYIENKKKAREKSEERRRRKKQKRKEKEREKEREKDKRRKKKKKKSDDSDDSEDEGRRERDEERRERSRKVMKEEGSVSGSVASDDVEELRKIALKSIKVEPVKEEEMEVEKEEEKGTKCFNPALIQFASAGKEKPVYDANIDPPAADLGRRKKEEDVTMEDCSDEEGEVREKEKKKKRKGDSRDRSRDRSERKRESGDKKEKEREKEKKKRRKERDGDDDNKYNANVSVPTEEEIKKKSDALLDDLFIYMMREKYAKDVADKEKLKNSGRMGFFKSKKEEEAEEENVDVYKVGDLKDKEEDKAEKERGYHDRKLAEIDRQLAELDDEWPDRPVVETDRKSSDRKSSDRKSSDRKSSDRKLSDRKSSDRKSSDRERKSIDREKKSSDRDKKPSETDHKTDRKPSDKDRKSSDKKASETDRKSSDRDRKTSDREQKTSDRDRRSSDKDRRPTERSGGSRRRSSSRGRSGKSRRRSRSKARDGKARSRSRSRESRTRDSGAGARRSRSQELLDAAGRFDRSRKTKFRMKQHLLDQRNLLNIAKCQLTGSQDGLRALSMQCYEIARKGLEEEANAPEEDEEEEDSSDDEDLKDVVLNVYATPSMMRISKSNSNYKNILNNELEKYGQMGQVAGFWMTPQGYEKAYEKSIGDGMGGKAQALYRPTGVSLLAIGYEGHQNYQKEYLPTTIVISTKVPEKWDNQGLLKTIFARASLFADINLSVTNPHGRSGKQIKVNQ